MKKVPPEADTSEVFDLAHAPERHHSWAGLPENAGFLLV
jgi:hypothetical protein